MDLNSQLNSCSSYLAFILLIVRNIALYLFNMIESVLPIETEIEGLKYKVRDQFKFIMRNKEEFDTLIKIVEKRAHNEKVYFKDFIENEKLKSILD